MTNFLSKSIFFISLTLGLAACEPLKSDDRPKTLELNAPQIAKMLPKHVKNADSWANDIHDIMQKLKIERNAINVCSIVAVIDQESNFVADPAVPNLGKKSLQELDSRLEDKLGKTLAGMFRKMLQTKPSPDNNFRQQIEKVKTERELDEVFRQMFSYFSEEYGVAGVTNALKNFGNDLSEKLNPITTLGSMQVHINYAKEHRRMSMSDEELRKDLYSQYGGLYYGIHRLMQYQADYDKPLYRFADYNAGVYSSRNAGFQQMLVELTGQKIALDGDLLLYRNGSVSSKVSETENLLLSVLNNHPNLTAKQIRNDLRQEKKQAFENTTTYKTIHRLYGEKTKKYPAYAIMPQVIISSPKMNKDYNTHWFATRVEGRYQTCMKKANPS